MIPGFVNGLSTVKFQCCLSSLHHALCDWFKRNTTAGSNADAIWEGFLVVPVQTDKVRNSQLCLGVLYTLF